MWRAIGGWAEKADRDDAPGKRFGHTPKQEEGMRAR